jgi:hypothetical protein
MTNIVCRWVMEGGPEAGGVLADGVLQDRIGGEVDRQRHEEARRASLDIAGGFLIIWCRSWIRAMIWQ